MNAYTKHLQNRERDLQLSDMRAFIAPIDAIANEFKSEDELLWRRKLALEVKHLRERLKNA